MQGMHTQIYFENIYQLHTPVYNIYTCGLTIIIERYGPDSRCSNAEQNGVIFT